jgi:hypothetical protein
VQAVDLTVIEPPENVFSPVTGYTEIHGVEIAIVLVPNLLALFLPKIRDRIPIKDEVDSRFRFGIIHAVLENPEPVQSRGRYRSGIFTRRGGCQGPSDRPSGKDVRN